MQDRIAYQGITFDDVLLEPAYSDVLPRDVDVRTQLTRNIRLNIPILSSPMDTVTDSNLAIALAQEGGIGIIHRNMPIAQQTREVDKVKRSENGIITDPITLPPDETVGTARRIMEQQHVGGVPITVNGALKGILTRRDLRFLTDNEQRLSEVMTKENLVTAPENTTLEAAERILTENKVEKLLLVDENYKLRGLITIRDIDKLTSFPNASKDKRGRLRVGAAVGVGEFDRADSLDPGRRGRPGRRLRPWPFGQRARNRRRAKAAFRHRRHRGQRGHRRGCSSAWSRREWTRSRWESGRDPFARRELSRASAFPRSRRSTRPPRACGAAAPPSSPTAAFATPAILPRPLPPAPTASCWAGCSPG